MNPSALDEPDDASVEETLPERPVTSVRDVEALYGRLYVLGRGLSGNYGPFLSPDAAGDLIGQERLVVTRVDLSGESATLADDPVRVVTYAEELSEPSAEGLVSDVPRVAHAKYESARGVDHSITHASGQSNGPDKHANHAIERFTRWPSEDAVRTEAETHDDGWLLDDLDALGNDEHAMQQVADAAREATEEGQFLHTVALRVDQETVSTTDAFEPSARWHLPGEIEVLQEAMVRRKTTKFRTKNKADDASGEGVCYVDDTEEEVYGVVDDPLKWYLSKQMERFPRLDPDQSWRTQGLGREAGIAAQNATTFLEACAEPAPGVSAYYLPYFEGEMNAADATVLYRTLVAQADDMTDRNAVAALYDELRDRGENDIPADLRFVFMIIEKYQKDRWRLHSFEPSATVHHGVELARSHSEVVASPVFGNDRPLPREESFDLLARRQGARDWLNTVTSVYYFARTCAPPDTDDDPSSDDIRFRATADVTGGHAVDVDALLGAYVDLLADRFDPDAEYPFPATKLAEQHAQLTALANTSLLDTNADTDFTVDIDMTEATDDAKLSRTEQLNDFIDRHDALSGEDAYERRAAFLLGALNGRITRRQRRENRGSTAVTTYPVDGVTKHNLKRTARELLTSNFVYTEEARKEGIQVQGTLYAELVEGIVEEMEHDDPTTWDLSTDDLRYHYAMGIAYGLNDSSTSNYEDTNE